MLAQPLPEHTELIGVWFDDSDFTARYTIYRTSQGVFLSTLHKEGGKADVEELVETFGNLGQYRFKRKDRPGRDVYRVRKDGSFEIGNGTGDDIKAVRVK